MKLELTPKTTQTLTMTQQMELSIRILEMDTLELSNYIQEFSLENPTVELDPETGAASPSIQREKKLEWLDAQGKHDRENRGYYAPPENALEKMAAAPDFETLAAHLHSQLTSCGAELYPVVLRVIDALDADGYLRVSTAELAASAGCELALVQAAVAHVQGLEPPGVGAGDLAECLLLQLATDDDLARRIVESHLSDLAADRLSKIAKQLEAPRGEVEAAAGRIRSLNPRPGSGFGQPEPTPYVTPDVIVTTFPDHYNVLPCDFAYPDLRLNQSYMALMRESGDKAVEAYIDKKVKQAQWVQKCIENRKKTLLSVAKAIVARQERFFFGEGRYLSVLRMSDIAAELEIHESTVSRAVKHKYLQCAHGTFALRYFFVQSTRASGLDGASSHELKCKIREMIEGEDKRTPLSDQKIADALEADGMQISRRAVAKYRDELLIPKSAYRRVSE
ncbi:MAG: RNA polymerase factor sigma-54 [Oscillospiraceae bacterium]|nr:RNA polymerase factor sigma-54 [Oscillospiraceae bacterium]